MALSINGLNTPINRQISAEWLKQTKYDPTKCCLQ